MYLAALLMFITLVLILLIIILAIVPLNIVGAFYSENQPDVYLTASWLSPVLKADVTRVNSNFLLTIYFLNRKVLLKKLSNNEGSFLQAIEKEHTEYLKILKSLRLSNVKVSASYGFEDPSVTGMLCGAIDLISEYVVLEEFYNNADFTIDNNYFNISIEAELYITMSLINILRRRLFHTNTEVVNEAK